MRRVLPILFNTEMVRETLDGRKMVTRRKIDVDISNQFDVENDGKTVVAYIDPTTGDSCDPKEVCRYHPGDILYVRETWNHIPCIDCNMGQSFHIWCKENPVDYDDGNSIEEGCFIYKADYPEPQRICWRPSIHMPKQAARIWLKVTDLRVERLKEIDTLGCRREGIDITGHGVFKRFSSLWDSTIRKKDIYRYGWDANPWVWVIEFERCRKPEN